MPLAIRPHLRTPITANVAFTAEVARNINGLGSHAPPSAGDSAEFGVSGYTRPGAWMLGSDLMPLKKADGTSFTQKDMKACMTGNFPEDTACLAKKNLHFSQTYHPASRYWPFQWMEMSIFLALALAMTAVCFWRVQRVS
jgi:hypothetical protein